MGQLVVPGEGAVGIAEDAVLAEGDFAVIGEDVTILGHCDLPNVHKDCPCFDAQTEYAEI